MAEIMIIGAVVLLLCVVSSKLLYKFGVPTLLIFIFLGMLFGVDGIVGIEFDNYEFARQICSFGLIFIMFYGGFSTNWKVAKPVAVPSVLMSTLGVVMTAFLVGLFCNLVLGMDLIEGMLIGSVVASTDAASVFAILRSRNLNLKDGLASLLELESGSNDPFAYMLTIIFLGLLTNDGDQLITVMLLKQIGFGLNIGFLLGYITSIVLKNVDLEIDGLYTILVISIVTLSYYLTELIGGNGYLCVYIVGIVLGNNKILHKRDLVHFFDGISWLMQIMLFFTLGLLSYPSTLPQVIVPGVLLSLFMIFIARPIATFVILSWFKIPIKNQMLVSWVGLRGAASIVFAIYVVTSNVGMEIDIFHMVFFVALFSVGVQGTLIPFVAKKLNLVEEESTVLKTFTDYQEETNTKLVEYSVDLESKLIGRSLMKADIPEEILVVMIKRGTDVIVPNGKTIIREKDILVLIGNDLGEFS